MKKSTRWRLSYLIILLLPLSLFSREFYKNFQNFSYHNNKISQAMLTFTSQTNNISLGQVRSGLNCSIKPGRQISTYSEWSDASVEYSNASPELSDTPVEWFQEYFKGVNPAKTFKEYKRYQFPGFRAFIKTLVGYKKHTKEQHKKLLSRGRLNHFLAKIFVASSPSNAQEFIQQMANELVQLEQQLNRLSRLYSEYKDYQTSDVKHSQLVSQRMCALQQSLDKDLQHSLDKNNWSDVNPTFTQEFNLDNSTFDLNGTPIQHVLQKEFHDIAQKTARAWKDYGDNSYIHQLVEKNVTCIKSGITHNQAGRVTQAAHFADIGWAILDHIQALGEGVVQGAGNVVHAFVHPIDTVQGITQAIAQLIYYTGQSTLEVVDLCILAATNQNAADKKLQAWKQNFTTLMDTIHKQLQETPNRDITKFVSSFIAEIYLTGKVGHGLGSFFSFARTKAAKFIQKAQKPTKSVIQVTTPGGITAQVNKTVKHTKSASKTGHTVKQTGATRLKAKPKAIKEQALQRRFPQPIKIYEGSLTNNNLKSNIIKKKFKFTEKMDRHIFSGGHRKDGILNLGKNRNNIVDKFVNIVKLADHKSLLKDGSNQIHTIINNQKVVLRFFIKEGEILMLNGFIETNVNNIGNVLKLFVKEYHHG